MFVLERYLFWSIVLHFSLHRGQRLTWFFFKTFFEIIIYGFCLLLIIPRTNHSETASICITDLFKSHVFMHSKLRRKFEKLQKGKRNE